MVFESAQWPAANEAGASEFSFVLGENFLNKLEICLPEPVSAGFRFSLVEKLI